MVVGARNLRFSCVAYHFVSFGDHSTLLKPSTHRTKRVNIDTRPVQALSTVKGGATRQLAKRGERDARHWSLNMIHWVFTKTLKARKADSQTQDTCMIRPLRESRSPREWSMCHQGRRQVGVGRDVRGRAPFLHPPSSPSRRRLTCSVQSLKVSRT